MVARRSLLVGVTAILLALVATLGTYNLFNSNLGPNGGPPPYPPRPVDPESSGPSWPPPGRGGSRAPATTASPDGDLIALPSSTGGGQPTGAPGAYTYPRQSPMPQPSPSPQPRCPQGATQPCEQGTGHPMGGSHGGGGGRSGGAGDSSGTRPPSGH